MSNSLDQLGFTLEELVPVSSNHRVKGSLAEQRIVQEVSKISNKIDYVFFRRFINHDVITSQPIAYIIDNTLRNLDNNRLARLHHTLWLHGTIPLLYVENESSVDILSCAAGPVSTDVAKWEYSPVDTIDFASDVSKIAEKLKQYSAFRLKNGTFWEDERNKSIIDIKKSAHSVLIEKVKKADRNIDGKNNYIGRRLLILTLLIKYLEDRGVFREAGKDFFGKYKSGASSFYDILEGCSIESITALLKELELKFNGDIFSLPGNKPLNKKLIHEIINVFDAKRDENNQLYFWDIYSFEFIPVEVLSHIYQHFAEKENGSIFTPILLVNIMLDQVMCLDDLRGDEKIFDPTCGSGIFLVSAFRRLVYINQRNTHTDRLSPADLKKLLGETIFGVELHDESAHIASFNLALAICDALRPDIIWNDLQFDKIIESNIFVGDIGAVGEKVLQTIKPAKGFDIILGNPPFLSKLTETIRDELQRKSSKIPDGQLSYYVLQSSIEKYLVDHGRLCMIQHYGFLYNKNSIEFRRSVIKQYAIEKILDFISIAGLFYDASIKVIALEILNEKPIESHKINHLTFRRTVATEEKIYFELDHYDYHKVSQKEALENDKVWASNLMGGGRLAQLMKRLDKLPSIEHFLKSKNWKAREGYTVGEEPDKSNSPDKVGYKLYPAAWLSNKPLITVEALNDGIIDKKSLSIVNSSLFARPRKEDNYYAPLMIVAEKDAFKTGFWENGFLAYTHEFIGIRSNKNDKKELRHFFCNFVRVKPYLQAILYLFSSRTFTSRPTITQKSDFMKLPWPGNDNFDFVEWEREILHDIKDYMAEFVRSVQDSKLLRQEASKKVLNEYASTFLRLLQKFFPQSVQSKYQSLNGLTYIVFSFIPNPSPETLAWLNGFDWVEKLQNIVEKEQSNVLYTQRVLHILTGDNLIIVKPSKLRYWIRSVAIWDVDEIMINILRGRKE